MAVSLKMCSTKLETICRGLDNPGPSPATSIRSECPRVPVSLGHASRILPPNFASTYVAISTHASSNVRKRFELSIKCFSTSPSHNASGQASFDLVQLVLQLFLTARHVGFPSFDPRLKFQERAPPKRNDRAKESSLSSSCRKVVSFSTGSPCLQRVLPRVVDIEICVKTRESHECCVHLLQQELQMKHTWLHVRCSQQEFKIDEFCRDFRRPPSRPLSSISDYLITPAKNASVFFDHC